MWTFFAFVLVLWLLLHAYVAHRLVSPLRSRRVRRALYAVFGVLCPLGPGAFVIADALGEPWLLLYRWVAWVYAGAFSTLFALVVCRDLLLGALHVGVRVRATGGSHRSLVPSSPERRAFLMRASAGGLVATTAALSAWGIGRARRVPAVVEVTVPIAGLPKAFDGYHIVQLSDIHVGETIGKNFILPIVDMVMSLKPDLVAVTGDIVDGSVDRLRADTSPLGHLRAQDGVLCVTGNHEYYSGAEAWCQHFEELGMSMLNNRHVMIARGDARLLVAGVTDFSHGKSHPGHASDPAAACANAAPHDVRILLAHQPRSAFEAAKHGYKLQLSGHTHGGQYFPWNLFVGLVQRPFARGLGKHEGMWVYVSTGTCYWGPPIRHVPAEITSLRLQCA